MSVIAFVGEGLMETHAVALRVTPSLSSECKFWLEDDSWNGQRPYTHLK